MKDNYKEYFKRLLIIAVPLILGNIINQLQMLIDRVFLGNANSIYMSVLGNVIFPVWCTMSVCYSIATGASILISQAVGSKNDQDMEEYAGSLMKYNNIIPFILFFVWCFFSRPIFKLLGVSEELLPLCVEYSRYYSPVFLLVGFGSTFMVIFQTSNHTKHLAWSSLIRSVLNIFFDWVLISGNLGFPAMGIKGAAIGTTLAEYLGGIYLVVSFLKSRHLKTRPTWHAILASKFKSFLHSAKLGINTAMEDLLWNIGNLVIIRILNYISVIAAGIYTIVFGVEVLAIVVVGALGQGTLTLTSEAIGKRDVKQYKGVCICAYSICFALAVLMMIAGVFIPEQIIAIFTKDKEIIQTSAPFLLLIGINLISRAGNIIVGNGIRGFGDTKWMLFTQIFGTIFIIAVASLFVFVFHLGITGVFLAVIADEFVRCVINTVKFTRICKKIA